VFRGSWERPSARWRPRPPPACRHGAPRPARPVRRPRRGLPARMPRPLASGRGRAERGGEPAQRLRHLAVSQPDRRRPTDAGARVGEGVSQDADDLRRLHRATTGNGQCLLPGETLAARSQLQLRPSESRSTARLHSRASPLGGPRASARTSDSLGPGWPRA
jgi:hypothetical protein